MPIKLHREIRTISAQFESQTILQLLEKRVHKSASCKAYWSLESDGNWKPIKWKTFYQGVIALAQGLRETGLEKGQVVGIMAPSCYQWELVHYAILAAGGVVVGLDPQESPEQLENILQTVHLEGLFVSKSELLRKFNSKINTKLKFIIEFEDSKASDTEVGNHYLLSSFINEYQEKSDQISLLNSVKPNDIATIIFTSGTTGVPKGIAYRHEQIIFSCMGILEAYPDLEESSHLACWLPLSNIMQRMINLCAIAQGAQTYFVENAQDIVICLPQINPHIFIAVPRFFEKLYLEFESRLAQQPRVIGKIVRYCLSQAERIGYIGKLFKLLNRIIVHQFRALFGSNLQYMISGSAPMPLWLLKRFDAMGLLILEAYGFSENISLVSANCPDNYRFGSVGKPVKGNQIKLSEECELLAKGAGVFNGYYKRESELTLDNEGYLASGDFAEIDTDGFIRLTGRKSEIFKTSTGRKIAPAGIEGLINQTSGVDQVAIFGAGKQFLIAVVTGILTDTLSEQELISHADLIARRIAHTISELPTYKRPAGFILSFRKFTTEGKELTVNFKLKRATIFSNYAAHIDRLYAELEGSKSGIHDVPILINQDMLLLKLARGK